MNTLIRICAAIMFCATSASQAETHPLRYIEAAFSLYNPDWEARENASGLALRGSLPLTRHIRISGSFNFLETDPVLDRPVVRPRGMSFKNWRTGGVGVFGVGPAASHWTLDLNLAAVDVAGETESGGSVMLGIHKAFDRAQVSAMAGYLDLAEEPDSVIEAALAYGLTPTWFATARIRDYAEWDFTLYELGLRWQPQHGP